MTRLTVPQAIAVSVQIVLTVGFAVGSVYWTFRWMGSGTARSVVKRLRKHSFVVVKANQTWGVWNPARPDNAFNPIYGPGFATYRIDESRIVHLHFRPKIGEELELSGPVPDAFFEKSANQRRQERVLIAYAAGLVVAFGLTFLFTSGSTTTRLIWGGAVAVIVMIALALGLQLLLVVVSTSSLRRSWKDQNPTSERLSGPTETSSSDSSDVWRRVEKNEQIAQRYLDEHQRPPSI